MVDIDIQTKVSIFQQKIQEYFLSRYPYNPKQLEDKSFLHNWPLYKFDIDKIFRALSQSKIFSDESHVLVQLGDKLIDIKLVYCYLLSTTNAEPFHRGPALIVGNNNLKKLNPDTLSLLRENHYKVYLLSVLSENLLDFMQLLFWQEITDFPRGKWEKIIDKVQKKTDHKLITKKNGEALVNFKNKYRTAEMHKLSIVRSFTAKDRWNHFDEEQKIIGEIIEKLTNYILNSDNW